MQKTILLIAAIASSLVSIRTNAQDVAFPIEPHAATQLLLSKQPFWPLDTRDEDGLRNLAASLAIAREDRKRFVEQVVYFTYHMKEQIGVPVVYRLLQLAQVSEGDFAVALSPLLYCEDPKLRQQAWSLFPLVYNRGCPFGYRNMSGIRDYLKSDKQNPIVARNLNRAVFETSPSAAFLEYHADAKREELIRYRRLERVISNALYQKAWLGGIPGGKVDESTAAAIAELANSKFWWARMFASEIMVQNKEFRDVELIDRLTKDENELVRQSAASVEKPDAFRATKVDR